MDRVRELTIPARGAWKAANRGLTHDRNQSRKYVQKLLASPGASTQDGLELLRGFRDRRSPTPVLIITARSEVDDRIRGLDLGADDYLTKPFELGEFDARVRALMRRSQGRGLDRLTFGAIALDISARRAFLDDQPLDLPRREFHILEVLMTRQGSILNKEQIIDRISDFEEDLSPSAIEIYVSRLRKKLEPAGITIRTVRGVGYSLE